MRKQDRGLTDDVTSSAKVLANALEQDDIGQVGGFVLLRARYRAKDVSLPACRRRRVSSSSEARTSRAGWINSTISALKAL